MLKTIKNQSGYYIYDEDLINDVTCCFDASYWEEKNKIIGSAQGRGTTWFKIIGSAQGRGTTWFVQLESMQGALRHYRRGGLFGKIISDEYLFTGYEQTRSIQEFKLLTHLRKQDVNVPKPIAAKAKRHGLIYRADILSEKIPNATDLVDLLIAKKLTELEYQAIGQEVKKLHQAQVNHTDLNIHNILLDKQGKVWIIDFDKCAEKSGDDWKEENLSRLLRSFRKEVKKRAIHWDEDEWQYLLTGYK